MKRHLGTFAVLNAGIVISPSVISSDALCSHTSARARRRHSCCVTFAVADNNRDRQEQVMVTTTTITTRPTFVISGASRYQDYEDIGSLLVDTFDSSSSSAESRQVDGGKYGLLNNLLWKSGVTKALAAKRYTNRYISNVRKMRGKKYSPILAKSFGSSSNNNGNEEDSGQASDTTDSIRPGTVVGVAEVGLSRYPLLTNSTQEDGSSKTEVLASIGVLAVNPSQRKSGIGSALLAAAESVARRWNETYLYAAVEPNNYNALNFFCSCGYKGSRGEMHGANEESAMVSVSVTERMQTELRPHILLRKDIRLPPNESDVGFL